MNIFWRFKVILVFLFALSSCRNSQYKVYSSNLKKNWINLSDTNTVVILKNYVACSGCIPELVDDYTLKKKKIIIVSLVDKDPVALKMAQKDLGYIHANQLSIFYQFHKKTDPYSYRFSNKIFRKFDHFESPIVLLTDSLGSTVIQTYKDFKNKTMGTD